MRQTPPGLRCGSISNTGRLGSPFSRSSADSVSITTPNRIQQRSLQAPVSTSDIAEKAAMPALLKTCLAQDLPCSRLALLKTCLAQDLPFGGSTPPAPRFEFRSTAGSKA